MLSSCDGLFCTRHSQRAVRSGERAPRRAFVPSCDPQAFHTPCDPSCLASGSLGRPSPVDHGHDPHDGERTADGYPEDYPHHV